MTHVGQTAEPEGGLVFIHSDTVTKGTITHVGITAPFVLVTDHCTGAEVGGVGHLDSPEDADGVRSCQLQMTFRPTAPAPIHADYPDQGYFQGALTFTVQATCTDRTAPTCSQVPASTVVDASHPALIEWQTSVDLYGSTSCPKPTSSSQPNGCPEETPPPSGSPTPTAAPPTLSTPTRSTATH